MLFEITTQQGNTYQVDDNSAWLWIAIENDLGLTYGEAIEKIKNQSLNVITYMLHHLALEAGHTQLKTQKAWVQHEFLEFDVVDADPKDPAA